MVNLDNVKWYVLHTYSGYENMVKDNLELVFKKNDMLDKLFEIAIPMEDVVEEKNGKTKIVQRRMMPSYVFIKMDYNNDMWHMITNTRGVTGFVGPLGRPLPLSDEEVKRMRLERPATVVTDFRIGESVKIVDGALSGFIGTIDSIDVPAENARLPYRCSVALRPWIFRSIRSSVWKTLRKNKTVYIFTGERKLANHRDCINKSIFTRSQ